jgi:hypothetical protein
MTSVIIRLFLHAPLLLFSLLNDTNSGSGPSQRTPLAASL